MQKTFASIYYKIEYAKESISKKMRRFFSFLIIFGLLLCLLAEDESEAEEENPEEPKAEPTSIKIGVLSRKTFWKRYIKNDTVT